MRGQFYDEAHAASALCRVLHRKQWADFSPMKNVLFVFGTRPEAIKLCPVIAEMRNTASDLKTRVCVTAQHREMLDQVLDVFHVVPDYDLNVMAPGQSLFASSSKILDGMARVLNDPYDLVVVQGDTTTTLCGSLAAFYARVPVAHIEAGLRTGNFDHPYPEEMNRVLTSRIASLHFAATDAAAVNLRNEGIRNETIFVTGNTVIDAVLSTTDQLRTGRLAVPRWNWLVPDRKLILVTAHRRESFGVPFTRICHALATLAQRPDVQVAYAVHPNPNVRAATEEVLRKESNVVLLEPLPYVSFIDLMSRAHILLTDSGGIQEEGPALGKPVLVLRETTERPEAVAAGVAKLVGTSEKIIVDEASYLLDNPTEYENMARRVNPYGDGRASERIVSAIRAWVNER
jgi:UDP-N-acetylglucosamine 2-epimerase (non-hydrolysing)